MPLLPGCLVSLITKDSEKKFRNAITPHFHFSFSGFSYGGNVISLKNSGNVHVFSGCPQSSTCAQKDPCGAKGTCISVFGSAECQCDKGYHGYQCVDVCTTQPCKNGGTCTRDGSDARGFSCLCPHNYTGRWVSLLSHPLVKMLFLSPLLNSNKSRIFCPQG